MAESSSAALAQQKTSRLQAVDALRGVVMVLMALDHANLFVAHKHSPGEYYGGAFPAWYDPLAFVTRLLTHPAAPGFFLLLGAGIVLFAHSRRKRGWSEGQIVRHLWIRGALLMALQLLLVNRAWEMSPGGWGIRIYIGVLFAQGLAMIVGTLFLRLKPNHLLILAAVLLVGTELLVPPPSAWGPMPRENLADWLNPVLLVPGGFPPDLWSNYPMLPWLELVVFGMALANWLLQDAQWALDRAWKLGVAFLVAFVVLRYLDGFGNIRPRMGNRWIDYLNVVKYPPSITFTLLTTGVNLLLLGVFGRLAGKAKALPGLLAMFGRAPLFFYVSHLFLYVVLGRLLAPNGTSIAAMYPYWLLGLAILFPLSWWYGQLKQRQPAESVLHYF
jgi:uncharacterized membrane protein